MKFPASAIVKVHVYTVMIIEKWLKKNRVCFIHQEAGCKGLVRATVLRYLSGNSTCIGSSLEKHFRNTVNVSV